jgi:hypothetical protein
MYNIFLTRNRLFLLIFQRFSIFTNGTLFAFCLDVLQSEGRFPEGPFVG